VDGSYSPDAFNSVFAAASTVLNQLIRSRWDERLRDSCAAQAALLPPLSTALHNDNTNINNTNNNNNSNNTNNNSNNNNPNTNNNNNNNNSNTNNNNNLPRGGLLPSGRKLRVFIVFPGVGMVSKLPLLFQSMHWLRDPHLSVTCMIYLYTPLDGLAIEQHVKPCHAVHRKGNIAHFLLAPPPSMWENQDYVLILHHDAVVQQGANLRRMAEVMRCNNLGVLSLAYHPRCCACADN
ncbi:unnamed protein product, partial [Polarella glacialis]